MYKNVTDDLTWKEHVWQLYAQINYKWQCQVDKNIRWIHDLKSMDMAVNIVGE